MVSSYILNAIRYPNETVDLVCEVIREQKLIFSAIAVRGVSGLLIGAVVAAKLRKPLIISRRQDEQEKTHAFTLLEYDEEKCPLSGLKYIIIDDLISSGSTAKAIVNQINSAGAMIQPECIGVIAYAHGWADDSDRKFYANQQSMKIHGIPVYFTRWVDFQ